MALHFVNVLSSFLLLLAPALAVTPVTTNNLDTLLSNDKLKFVFVGGKGGVGKTTSSSAIASQLSLSLSKATNSNKRVLLISTDPAHSLSDAFRMKFTNVPTPIMPDLPNLEVMEVNPTETMNKELSQWSELAQELGYDPDKTEEDGGTIGEKIHSFQQWLSGIPGIDEATALSSAIEHIESGRYDMIVFDTAPTGHTLKLLELPKILQMGLDKIESWQATLWGYWEAISGGKGGSGVKEKVSQKLKDYKKSIGRVSDMIQDTERTRFVVVCISEYLSISESRRLLGELDRFKVVASHIVVNQLVTDYLETSELAALEEYTGKQEGESRDLLEKALAASRLTTSRRNIQTKYLKDLKQSPEVLRITDPEDKSRTNILASKEPLVVLEVPLLPSEVTGAPAILDFSHYLIGKEIKSKTSKAVGVEGERSKKARADEKDKAAADERAAFAEKHKPKKKSGGGNDMAKMADDAMKAVMADPELKGMIDESPKLQKIVQEVKANPMAAMQYMNDPDPKVQVFVQKAMAKLNPPGKGRKGKGAGGGADQMAAMAAMMGGMNKNNGGSRAAGLEGLAGMMKGMGGEL